jgi:serine/threonine protein kinase/tetratricopeptide (TPR) repeat protein
MQFSGLTDYPISSIDACNQCRCGSVARVRSGLCASCLLKDALEGDHLDDVGFELELAEINVPDRDWRLGNYQILEEIARGGMGVVYRARHLASRRIVAVKRVLTYHSDSQQTLARFQREAEAAASLDHPNILPIYDVGTTDDGLPYFSMKFAAGGSLLHARDLFRDDPRRSAQLILKVARAIDYAHGQGIVHRDLKPGNILLDAREESMVADFGLAKWLDSGGDLTCTLTVFGTPGYIAPEQAQGSQANLAPTVDVYSLGAILFELLSGRPPFVGEHALGVIQQAAERPAPKLRSVAPAVPRDLETICARCLERLPWARYSSAGDLALDIERWLDDRPIVARRLSLSARVWRWSRRNRALAASISACVILASAAITWQIDNSRLDKAVRDKTIAGHSVAVLPFLNLDEATPDVTLAGAVADLLRARMLLVGPAKVISLPTAFAKWTGTGISAEIDWALKATNCRAALVGMFRRTPQGIRVSLRLLESNSTDKFQNWTAELRNREDIAKVLTTLDIGAAVYHFLDTPDTVADLKPDPALIDPTARGYFNAGRSLLDRRTIPDMDRAINCFEGAIRAAPQSVVARSYLALAYIGRNFLAANPIYIDRACSAAKEALQIWPEDSSAHRALCVIDMSAGHFDEALEHGLRALEVGDPSERALGQIGYIWEELGRPDRAIQWFAKAKVSQNQPPDYDAILGDAWLLLGEDDKAAEAYQTSSNFRPDLPEGWLGLCHLKLLQGDFKQAQTLFQRRAAEYSAFHTTKPFQAQLEFFTRNYPEAERLYSEILQADPRGVGGQQYGAISSMSALAKLKMVTGDYQAATELLQKCIAADQGELINSPKHPEVLYRLAAGEAIKGDRASALAYLRASIAAGYIDYRSMQMDPRFDEVANCPEFQQIVFELAAHVAELRNRSQTINTKTSQK